MSKKLKMYNEARHLMDKCNNIKISDINLNNSLIKIRDRLEMLLNSIPRSNESELDNKGNELNILKDLVLGIENLK